MAVRRLSALDAGFLALETDTAPLHVGALLILDGPAPDSDVVRTELVRRAATSEACRRRVIRRRGLRRPTWVDDPGADLGSHVHVTSLPEPYDLAALRAYVVELMGVRLDTSIPLWEAWVIDGLADGGWAVLLKAHHTLLDGVSGAGLLADLLSPTGEPPRRDATRRIPRHRVPLLTRAARLRQGVRTVAVPDLPASVLNGPLGGRRTWGWCSVDLAELATVADGAGCTVNDVYLAALSGGLRTALVDTGNLGAGGRVRVLVPVSTHTGFADVAANMDAAFFVDLPVHLASVRMMLDHVARQTAQAKADGVPLATEQLLHAGDLMPAPLLDRAAGAYVRLGQARVNLVASDICGPGSPLSLCDRPVRELVPCLPLALDVRVTSALLSYVGRVSISMTVDEGVGPDAAALVATTRASLEELVSGGR
jgi:diacylglycerol O-acyltransferase